MESKCLPGELSVKLFWDLANALPSQNHTNKLLRSYYLTTCKKIGRRDLKLPPEQFAPSVMCPKCSSIWSDSKFSLTLKPQRIHTQKAQKLVAALKNDPKSLTKKNRTRAKWLKKRITSNVEIKCEFCQKKTLQTLIKPKKSKIEQKQELVVEAVPIKKKKKKKGKDKTAGLKLEKSILQEIKPSSSKKATEKEIKDKTSGLKVEKTIPQETKPVSSKKANGKDKMAELKLEKVIPREMKHTSSKKTNKPKVQPQKWTMQSQQKKPEKVISKTQKQNSLLQLANMLKNRVPTASSKGNNQLEKLLR